MRLSILVITCLVAIVALAGCSSQREVLDITSVERAPEVEGDSLAAERARARITYVEAVQPTPDVAPDRSVDILSTALDLRFDIQERRVTGRATHALTPLRDGLADFTLNAVGMEIEAVEALAGGPDVTFAYDDPTLTITPRQPLALGDTLEVAIDYVARPMQRAGGEARGELFRGYGLYFIDAEGSDPYRPTQLWTQGEPTDNRRWFPTWDYPNDKMTFEVALTLPDSMQAFSNGSLVESEALGDGMRRSVWDLGETPQAAYLAAIVAGDFAVTEGLYMRPDSSTVPLVYITEPRFAGEAEAIFGETPEMMRVFEDLTGTPFPWPEYKQAAVRDFVAGGMENTTLTILTEQVQGDRRDRLGRERDVNDLLAHELAHQWFGNLVTMEDWANLAVNESFATLFEMLYREAAGGEDAEQERALLDEQAYLRQAQRLRRPIVWYGYDTPGQLFDRHTYQKGGLVLRLLRFELGEDVFQRGLERFLAEFRGGSAEMDDLREAMEAVSGRSLRRFFSTWFQSPGHPDLRVEQSYFPGSGLYTVQVTQRQSLEAEPVFHVPVRIEVNHADGRREVRRVRLTSADSTFEFSARRKPTFVRFDEGAYIPGEVALQVPVDELAAQATQDDELAGRFDAVAALEGYPPQPAARTALLSAATDDHPLLRRRALAALAAAYPGIPDVGQAIVNAFDDPDPKVRAAAAELVQRIGSSARPSNTRAAMERLLSDEAYMVVGSAVRPLAQLYPQNALAAFASAGLFDMTTWGGTVERPLAQALGQLGTTQAIPYLREHAGPDNPDGVRVTSVSALARVAAENPDEVSGICAFFVTLLEDRRSEARHAAAQALGSVGTADDIRALNGRLADETDPEVREAIEEAVRQIRARSSNRTMLGNPLGGQ